MADKESRKKQITAKRREQILKAALEVFSHKGYSAATIPEIARLAGVATGTIYLYFPSKRDLFVAVIENLLATPLVKIFEKDSQREFPPTLKEAIEDRFNVLQEKLQTFLLPLMGEIQRDPELRVSFRNQVISPFLSTMEMMYRGRIKTGEFRRMEPAVVVRLIGGMMIGINLIKILEGKESPLDRLSQSQLTNEVMNFILHGLMNNQKNFREKTE